MDTVSDTFPITYEVLYNVFPFHLVFNNQLTITNVGTGLMTVMSHLMEQSVDEMFTMTRPLVEFSMENVRI